MKKIFTLLLTVSMVTGAFAQYQQGRFDNGRHNGSIYNDDHDRRSNGGYYDHYNERRYNYLRMEMEKQIADINREYDNRICRVKDNWFMNPFRKQRIINELECRRKDEIKSVYANFYEQKRQAENCEPERHW